MWALRRTCDRQQEEKGKGSAREKEKLRKLGYERATVKLEVDRAWNFRAWAEPSLQIPSPSRAEPKNFEP